MKKNNPVSTNGSPIAEKDRYSRVLPIRQVVSSYLTDLRTSKVYRASQPL